MALTRIKAVGRRERGPFLAIPRAVLTSPNFERLTPSGVKLFIDLAKQLKFKGDGIANNGDLSIEFSKMQRWGWRSKEPLYHALSELIHYGFVIRVLKGKKYGGRRYPSLYAVTWLSLDDVGEHCRATTLPSSEWRKECPCWVKPKRKRGTNFSSTDVRT